MGKTVRAWKYIPVACSVFLTCWLIAGCGSRDTDSLSSAPAQEPKQAHAAAAGPAVEVALRFDQIALESPPRRVKDPNGLEFLHFRYADVDGKVYKCTLPAAMAKEPRTPAQWLALFEMYREPEAVAATKPRPTAPKTIGDFPFISPRPAQAPKPQDTGTAERAPAPLPSLPSMPTQPGGTTGTQPAPMAPVPAPGSRPLPVGPEGGPPAPPPPPTPPG